MLSSTKIACSFSRLKQALCVCLVLQHREPNFWFCLHVFPQVGPSQGVDCLLFMGNNQKVSSPRTQRHFGESNVETATSRSISRCSTTELSKPLVIYLSPNSHIKKQFLKFAIVKSLTSQMQFAIANLIIEGFPALYIV